MPFTRRVFLRLSAALFALSCAAPSQAAAPDAQALAGGPLLAALKTGGLVLYFRHTSTDFGQNDEQMTGFEDCARQRNLTDLGRDEAKVIGCLTNTGGVADEVEYLLEKFSKPTGAQVFLHTEPEQLLAACLDSL